MALNFNKFSSVESLLQRTVALGRDDCPVQLEQYIPASSFEVEIANGSKSDGFTLYKSDSQKKREKKNARKAQQAKRLAEDPIVFDGMKMQKMPSKNGGFIYCSVLCIPTLCLFLLFVFICFFLKVLSLGTNPPLLDGCYLHFPIEFQQKYWGRMNSYPLFFSSNQVV